MNLDTYAERIAKTFSLNRGVKVVVAGTALCADVREGVVYIPASMRGIEKNAALRSAFEGALDHECSHVAEESMWPTGSRPSDLMTGLGPVARSVWNAVEDVRIERRACARMPGARANLLGIHTWAVAQARGDGPVLHRALCRMMSRAQGRAVPAVWAQADQAAVDAVLDGFVAEIAKVDTPRDAVEIAERIVRALTGASGSPEGEGEGDDEGEPGEDGESEDGEGDGEGSDDGEGLDAEGDEGDEGEPADEGSGEGDAEGDEGEGKGSGEGADAEGDEGETDAAKGGKVKGDPDAEGEAVKIALDEAISAPAFEGSVESALKMLGEAVGRSSSRAGGWRGDNAPARVKAADKFVDIKGEATPTDRVASALAFARTTAQGATSRLISLLVAQGAIRVGEQESGRLDSRALASVSCGERRVFTRDLKRPSTSTAVTILLDASGSMSNAGRVDMALRATFVMARVFEACGVPYEVVSFTHVSPDFALTREERIGATRHEYALEKRMVRFGERVEKCAPNFNTYGGFANNDDGGALVSAARRVADRPENRKIVITVSDGIPEHVATRDDSRNGLQHLREAVAFVNKAGIEAAGLGVCHTGVKDLYPINGVVDKETDIIPQVTHILRELLKKRGTR